MRSTLRHADWFARPGDKVLLAGRKVENHHKRMCELLLSRTALLPTSAHPDSVQWSSKFREETTKRKAPSTSGTKGERVDEDSFFVWRSVTITVSYTQPPTTPPQHRVMHGLLNHSNPILCLITPSVDYFIAHNCFVGHKCWHWHTQWQSGLCGR